MTSELPNSDKVGGEMRGRKSILPSWSTRGLCFSCLVLLAGTASTIGDRAFAQDAAPDCVTPIGRVISLQGNVEVQRASTPNWRKVTRLDTMICAGDRLRTDVLGRAALFLQPETLVRVDQNTTISVNQTTAEVLIEFHIGEVSQAAQNAQACGAGYFITRFPRKFKVSTPHMNAAVEGTEFMVESSCKASALTVLEGQVRSQSLATQESRSLTAGQRFETGPAAGAVFSTVVRPVDAVQWVLRFPRLTDAESDSSLPGAPECQALEKSSRLACLTGRADAMLRLGRADQALQDIDQALALDTMSSEALALRAIIQVAKNDQSDALDSAGKATAANPENSRAWLAQSYAQQASFELEQALVSATHAASLQSNSALINSRIAELQLSLGRVRAAEQAASAAVTANPADSHGHTILGFVYLAQIDTGAAKASFETAIQRDSFSAMPRLGLGLAMIREGNLVAGREQLEIAVALDPSNSLLRSYVGRAYFEENSKERESLAAMQFDAAKGLDPLDPTPWFFNAMLQQSQNRPVGALDGLRTSIEKNENRAVYRSRLLVDDDAAARAASVAAIYDNLGFEKLAIGEGTKALTVSAANSSAHHQLAIAYGDLPRHDIARVSEALQSQILQPVSLSSVSPLLGTDNLAINRDSGPARSGVNEFNSLFNQNGLQLQFDGIAGGLDTLGNQFVASALVDRFSYTLSQFHYETDGFVDNDAVERDVYGFLVHGQISPSSSIQLDLKRSDVSIGQTFFPFDEFPTPTTILEQSDTLRVSGHHQLESAGDLVWSAIVEDRERAVRSFPDGGLFFASDASPYAAEVQYLGHFGEIHVTAGAGYVEDSEEFRPEPSEIRNESSIAYAYAQWKPARRPFSVQFGLAAEQLESRQTSEFAPADDLDQSQLSPKLGVVWWPRVGTTIRAAAFSSLHRPFIRSQTIEPTQVAGFNQFFSGYEQVFGDFIGTISDRVGVGVDQAFSPTAFGGMEISSRRLDVPSFILDRDFTWREKAAYAYFYKTFSTSQGGGPFDAWQASVSVELEYEEIDRPPELTGAEGIVDLTTLHAPLGIRFFHHFGTTLRLGTTYVEQDGRFSIDFGLPVVEKEDDAWITDLSVEQRLPGRRGFITVGVRNLFDESIDLLEIDPFNPRVATKQFVYARFSLVF